MQFHSLPLLGLLCAFARCVLSAETLTLFNTVVLGDSIAQYVSGTSGLDGPKMSPEINATSFDWWYFDAVAEDGLSAIVIVFYVSTTLAFLVPPLSTLSASIFATFEDGSILSLPADILPNIAGEATITTDGDGASGIWKGTGFEFQGTPDLSSYVVTINAPLLGVSGTLELTSVSTRCTAIRYFSKIQLTRCYCIRSPLLTIHVVQTSPAKTSKCRLTSDGQMLYLTQMQ